MLTPLIRTRVTQSLEGAPTVLSVLVASLASGDPRWDRRFYADRFTLREVIAHLVDYDGVWMDYLNHALSADVPVAVPLYTPDSVAAKRDYSESDPMESLNEFRARRKNLVAKLRAVEEPAWAHHTVILASGAQVNIDELATLFVAHDGYHASQIAEFVTAAIPTQDPET